MRRWVRFTGLVAATLALTWGEVFASDLIPVKIALSEESPPNSFVFEGKPKGLFVDLYNLLFRYMPAYAPELKAFPWARAQNNLQIGTSDVFCTFPSETRKQYADFASTPLFVWDYGYLVYDLENPKRKQIESAKSFNDLKDLVFVSQESVEWEKENVPAFIKRYFVTDGMSMMHMTFSRKAGDFFIMSPEQAIHYCKELGYLKQLGLRAVEFIPNSQIKFHVGIRKTFPGHNEFLATLEKAMKNPAFLKQRLEVIAKYTQVP